MRIDPLSEKVGESNRLVLAKDTTKNMTAMIPEIKMNAGLRTFWAGETALIYGMKPLVKRDYTKAINSIEHENGRTPMGKAITAAGNDLRGAPVIRPLLLSVIFLTFRVLMTSGPSLSWMP